MAIFSVTELGEYRRCRRKWNYSSKSRMNLSKKGFGAEALELGSLVHLTLAQWVLEPKCKPEELFAGFAAELTTKIIETYENEYAMAVPDDVIEAIANVTKLGIAMMKNYGIKWKSPVPENMKFAAVEQEIVIPIPGTDHQLSATLDGLLQDANNWLYVLERKTYSQRPSLQKLLREDQFTGYVWVIKQANIGKVRGVAYDGMWKREAPPRGSNFDDLFFRQTLHKTPGEIDAWGHNLAELVNEMASNPPLYPNIPWQGCFDCGYIDLCDRQLQGDTLIDIQDLINRNYKPRDVNRIQGIASA